jgi:DNA polymerase I-like protein with 3'-5' exonuclease and polymerase domains
MPKIPALATIHPAALMRDQVLLPVVINDLRKSLQQPPENYILHPSIEQVRAFTATEFAFDIETAYWFGDAARITMVGLSDRLYHAMVVPFQGEYVRELKRIFRAARAVIGHNSIQFDMPILRDNGVILSGECQEFDTMLLQHLRFPDLPHDLEFVGSQFSNKPAWKADKKDFELYCARDVDVTFQAFKQLKPMVEQCGMMDLYKLVQIPLAKICHGMHKLGVRIDPTRIEEVRERVTAEIAREELALPEHLRSRTVFVNRRHPAPVGTLGKSGKPVKFIRTPEPEQEIPWRSSAVIAKWLYGKNEGELGLEPVLDLKTNEITTGKMAIAKLYNRTKNPAIRALGQLRKKNSMLTLFAKEKMIKAGTIHTHFNVQGTASGRLSSSDPNLQNITEAARVLYVPRHSGWSIIDVDYSGIENRLTAYFAGDSSRLDRFLSIPDYSEHKHAASIFFGIPYNEVVKDNDKDAPYGKAKRIVHGSNYGMGAKKISLMYDMEFSETKRLLDEWKKELSATVKWQNGLAAQAKREGYLTTPFGRRRWFYTTSYYTESLSFLPQSAAADVIFRAMLGIMYERISWPLELLSRIVPHAEPLPRPANLLLQVHDSLLIESPNELIPNVVGCLKRVLEQPWPELGGLVLPIGVAVGPSWGETEKYEGPII